MTKRTEELMQLARRNRFVVGLLAILVVGIAALAGCTMVGDHLTGVQLNGAGPTTCVKQCNDAYAELYKAEQKRHDASVEYCQTLSQPTKGTCLVAEDAVHQANKASLTQGKIDCQNNCHRQGSGSAG
jgi:hypothetical protein